MNPLKRRIVPCVCLVSFLLAGSRAQAQWTQWGGPNQDFKVEGGSIAKQWPDDGPKELWSKKLGEGYSAIVADDGVLYTMYRTKKKKVKSDAGPTPDDDDKPAKDERPEVVVAMKASNGEVLWEYKYEAPPAKGHATEFGTGPRATPLVSGPYLYTVGISGKMNCLDKKTGKVIWSHDLWDEYKGSVLQHGYSSSPIAYKNNVIVMVGGKGHALMAFDKKTGEIAWQKHDYMNSYSTPKLIKVDGKDQLVCFMAKEAIGVNPDDGELLWREQHANNWNQNITLPIWDEEEHSLFITSPGEGGSKGLKLVKDGDAYKVERLWNNKKLGVHHTTAIRVGDTIYTSSGAGGGGGPSFLFAVDAKTGEIRWKERGFSKSNLLYADGHFLILDEDGNLALADCTPEGLKIISSSQVLKKVAWTVPTLVGKTLYVRDQNKIVAIDLG